VRVFVRMCVCMCVCVCARVCVNFMTNKYYTVITPRHDPPNPTNHLKILKGQPRPFALWELVPNR